MNPTNLKKFKDFYLDEKSRIVENKVIRLFESENKKSDLYRGIVYKLSEIFSLYGFFLAQKKGFFNAQSWPSLMNQIISIKDHDQKWEAIVNLSKNLQEKTEDEKLRASKGEFGFSGGYDYGQETKSLPQATGFLKAASNAAFKKFSDNDKKEALVILDTALKNVQPFKMSRDTTIQESKKYADPTQFDLIKVADSTGSKLMNMYNTLDNLKASYPESSSKIDPFLKSSIIPNLDKVKSFIEVEIPKVKGSASVGFLKKLQIFDESVDSLLPKLNDIRSEIISDYGSISTAKEFEDSASKIISKVKSGILKQAEINARWIKSGDTIVGSTDIKDPKHSGDAQVKSTSKDSSISKDQQPTQSQTRQKKVDDLTNFLSKKYSLR
jgi:hypothetical protein